MYNFFFIRDLFLDLFFDILGITKVFISIEYALDINDTAYIHMIYVA